MANLPTDKTNNPIGSTAPVDMAFNAAAIDCVVNDSAQFITGRLGKQIRTLAGINSDADGQLTSIGWNPVGTFSAGFTINETNEVGVYTNNGFYRWAGARPKVVPPGSTPDTTGGTGPGAWSLINDVEQALSSQGYTTLHIWPSTGSITLATDKEAILYTDNVYYSGPAVVSSSDTPFSLGLKPTKDGARSAIPFDTLSDALSYQSISIGDTVLVKERVAGNGGGGVWSAVLTSSVTPNTFNIVQSTAVPLISFVLEYSNIIDIDAWGFVADGTTSDRAAVGHMISSLANGTTVDFKNKEIFLGDITDSDLNGIFAINLLDNITFANKPRWKINNLLTGAVGELKIAPVFRFTDCNELTLTCNAEGDTYDVNSPHGPAFYYVENNTIDTTGLYIDTFATNGIAACMIEQRTGSDKRLSVVRGLNGGHNITYGHRAFQSGDDAIVDISASNHARSYFPIQVSDQQITINSRDQQRVDDVLIKCFVGDMKNINVSLNQRGSVSDEWPVAIEHENANVSQVSSITNVKVAMNTDAVRSGSNSEFFAITQRVTGGGVADFSQNITDEISFCLLGNQVSSANPKINIRSATVPKGTIHTDFVDDAIDTKGFTFLKSNKMIVKRRGPYSGSSKRLWMQQINRSTVQMVLTVCGVGDHTNGTNRWFKRYGLIAVLDNLGGGNVLNFNEFSSMNDAAAPTVTVSFSGFNLVVTTSGDSNFQGANAEICVTAEFLSNI